MAADYINVDRTKQLGNTLVMAADRTRELREMIDKLKDATNHSNDGSDYSLMETNFGIATGMGANCATLINILDNVLNGSGDLAGATRLGQIEEFVARLAGQ